MWSQSSLQQKQLSGHRGLQDQRSEEHTSELQSQSNLVCRLLLEKKKVNSTLQTNSTRMKTFLTTLLALALAHGVSADEQAPAAKVEKAPKAAKTDKAENADKYQVN